MVNCRTCGGSGKCTRCNGLGIITVGFLSKTEKECNKCGGVGDCKKCGGSGEIEALSTRISRVRCPKCGSLHDVESEERPFQIGCKCGTTLILKR